MEDLIDRTIKTLRKPEVRSEFTGAILKRFHEYFGEMFQQDSPPELIQQFKDREGIIFPAGSLLRGTARLGSDFDALLVYDGSITDLYDHPNNRDFESITDESEKFHPSRTAFKYWLARKFREDPSERKFLDERRELILQEIEASNQYRTKQGMQLRRFKEEDVEGRLIGMESAAFNIEELVVPTRDLKSSLNLNIDAGYLSRMGMLVPQLLTVNLEYVIESQMGALLYHQRRIVQALSYLEEQNPRNFQRVYENLALNFQRAVHFQSSNHIHAGTLEAQRKVYIEKSGRFSKNQVEHAAELLRGVSRQIKFPNLEAFKAKYLDK